MNRRRSHSRGVLLNLRPGIVLAMAVTSVVGIAGIIKWDRGLINIGLLAGVAILAMNVVLLLTRHWHRRNTELQATYRGPEDAIRLRRQGHAASGSKRR